MPARGSFPARLRVLAELTALPALLLLRLPPALDGLDSVNFALALQDYDLGLEQPHPPGYPVYIALARMLLGLGFREEHALALPGILAAALLLPALRILAERTGCCARSIALAVSILALHPLLLLEGPRPLPDLLGATLVWIALALCAQSRPLAGGAALGLALGVRADLLPFAGALLWLPGRARTRFALGAALGLVAWLPLFLSVGPPDLGPRMLSFLVGHLELWGSTLLAGVGEPRRWIEGALAPGPGAVGLALGVIGVWRMLPSIRRLLALSLLPYALWVLAGQNLAHARHMLPLAPAFALGLGCVLADLRTRTQRIVALIAVLIGAWPAIAKLREPALDGRELVVRAVAACDDCTAVYVGESRRLFDRYGPPGFPAYRRSSVEEIRADLALWGAPTGKLFATGEVRGVRGTEERELGGGLRLYRIDPAALR
ncbi:MAG: hypothetical protein ACE5FG_09695 [Myxococcota bacterium]